MKFSKYLFAAIIAVCLPTMLQAQYFPIPGTYSYSLNSLRHVCDVTPDGKIGVVLTNDPVGVFPARLTTFDPLLGTTFDNKTFGTGPLAVRVITFAKVSRVAVITDQRMLWLFDLSSTGKLTQISTMVLSAQDQSGDDLALSASGQVGFVIVPPANNAPGMDLLCFSLVDGSVVSRTTFPAGSRMVMNEFGGKRTLAFLKNGTTVELIDASNPLLPTLIGDATYPKNNEFSGVITSSALTFNGNGRYLFVSHQFADFAVIDTVSLQTISTIGGATNRFVRVRVYEDSQRRLLAIQGAASGTTGSGFIMLVDATDPAHLVTLGQNNSPGNFTYKGDMAFSSDGSRLYTLSRDGLTAYSLPNFTMLWRQAVITNASQPSENQLIVYGPTDELLGAWDTLNGGSFPANPPTATISDINVTEGDTGTVNAIFPITLSAPTNHRVMVNYATSGGTAIAGTDFTGSSSSLTFQPGETSKNVVIPILGDIIDEPDETFTLNFSAPQVALFPTTTVTGTIVDDDPVPTITINAAAFLEGAGPRNVNILFTLSAASAKQITLNYATADGTATAGSDYTAKSGALTFTPGQTTNSVVFTTLGDTAVEPDEFFSITFSNAVNVDANNPAKVFIVNDVIPGGNPIDLSGFFVWEQYSDFLNRQPDADGFNFWANNINQCGADVACTQVQRINTSAAFFLSIEFQQSGYLVERFYKCAFADASGASSLNGPHQISVPTVRFSELLPDSLSISAGVVVLAPGWEQLLEQHKQTFAESFVNRSRFQTDYPNNMTAADFVDKLNTRAGNPLSISERNQLVSDLTTNTKTRGQVLRAIAEHQNVVSAEFNRAFVLMQYFGYLKRNPNDTPDSDYTGYDFWLTKLNQFNGDYVGAEMVKAFIGSSEYRKRFGP